MKKFMLIFLSVITITLAQNFCRTPNNELAVCISIFSCPALLRNLQIVTLEHQQFFKESLCRIGQTNLGVCCGTYSHYIQNHPVGKHFLDIFNIPLFYHLYPKIHKSNKPSTRFTTTTSTTATSTTTTSTTTTSTTTTPAPVTEEDIIWMDPRTHPNFHLLAKDCGDAESTADRIFGGEETEINEFPWMARLEFRQNLKRIGYMCAGSLINKKYVLTAAHCISDLQQQGMNLFRIRLGEHNALTDQDCYKNLKNSDDYSICFEPQDIFVEETIVHPKYSIDNLDKYYDIALVRLKYPAQYSESVRPVCLPVNGETSKDKDRLTVVGWGYTENETLSQIKLKAVVPYVADEECKILFRDISYDHSYQLISSQFCAGGEVGIDSCQGDSGGPIMKTLPDNNTWYQEGIVSFGFFCGGDKPAVYTRVSSFLIWILDNLKP